MNNNLTNQPLIYFLDQDLTIIGVCDDYLVLVMDEKFYEVGSYHVEFNEKYYNAVMGSVYMAVTTSDYLMLTDEIELNSKEHTVKVVGPFAEQLLDFRVSTRSTNYSGSPSVILKQLIQDNLIARKPIPHLEMDDNIPAMTETFEINTYRTQVLESALSIMKAYKLSVNIRLVDKKLICYILQEREITGVVLSKNRENILSERYQINKIYKNFVTVAWLWRHTVTTPPSVPVEVVSEEYYTIDKSEGDPFVNEIFVDTQKETGGSETDGINALIENGVRENIEIDVSMSRIFNVGDIYTYQDLPRKLQFTKTIDAVTRAYENGSIKQIVTFGEQRKGVVG